MNIEGNWYRRFATGSSQAAAVAEAAPKPEAELAIQQIEAVARKLAIFLLVSDESLQDGGPASSPSWSTTSSRA